jgi:hypothetical protein
MTSGERLHRLFERLDVRRDAIEQALPIARETHTARAALEQSQFEPPLEKTDLMTECANGEMHRRRGAAQIASTCGGDEPLQAMERSA